VTNEFELKFTLLEYIINFDKMTDEMLCPICTCADNQNFAVLECGHYNCVDCFKTFCRLSTSKIVTCSVCRQRQHKSSFHLCARQRPNHHSLHAGEYSAKIANIVQVIWELIETENQKVLIFSEWLPMLKAIAKAFETNDISCRYHHTPKEISEFKDPEKNINCLLIFLHKGSKGY